MSAVRLWLVIFLSGMLWQAAAADTVYKYRTPDGKLVYSDQPPNGPAVLKELRVRRDTPSPQAARRAAREIRAYDQADWFAMRSYERAVVQADERVARAARALELAAQRYSGADEPLPGERVANLNGYSRLRPEYFSRRDHAGRVLAATEQEYHDALAARARLR